MTDTQKQKIAVMRMEGAGYKKIASELGLNRDSVRYFCKREGLNAGITEKEITGPVDAGICKNCGGSILQSTRGRARIFCSDECRRAWWSAHPEARRPKSDAVYNITCAGCGQEFESYGNRNRRYCSHKCYISYRFK